MEDQSFMRMKAQRSRNGRDVPQRELDAVGGASSADEGRVLLQAGSRGCRSNTK